MHTAISHRIGSTFLTLNSVIEQFRNQPLLVPTDIDLFKSPIGDSNNSLEVFRRFNFGSSPLPPLEALELIPEDISNEFEGFIEREMVRIEMKQIVKEKMVGNALDELINEQI
jgi:hypothetical protein